MHHIFIRSLIVLISMLVISTCGCSNNEATAPRVPSSQEAIVVWPKDWSELVGKTVALEGKAVNAKLGALLQGETETSMIWIDGHDSWPAGYSEGEGREKRVRVSGTVIRKDDVPVFVSKPGEAQPAGVPVESEADLEKAKWRYLIKDAQWKPLD
ncbi:MAG: hypothetical protein M5U26_07795 [Planctomycetota bacterium]|nr:hypothetical protein [Planctomycetota bacterium]